MTIMSQPQALIVGTRIWLQRSDQTYSPGRLLRFVGYRPAMRGKPACTLWGIECYHETLEACQTIPVPAPQPSYRIKRRYLPYTPAEKEMGSHYGAIR